MGTSRDDLTDATTTSTSMGSATGSARRSPWRVDDPVRWDEDAFGRRSLSRLTVDRDAARRREPDLVARLAADPATRLVLVDARGRVALDVPASHPDLPENGLTPPSWPVDARPDEPAHDVVEGADTGEEEQERADLRTGFQERPDRPRPHLAPLTAADVDATGLESFYLGSEPAEAPAAGAARTSWLAVVVPAENTEPDDAEGASRPHPDLARALDRHPLSALRAVGDELTAHDAGLATPAAALAAWHARNRYCPSCGSRTEAVEAGWARRCTGCGALQFPRTDPAVIMAVTDDADRIVLVHGAAWDPGRYSTVAGFVEAGEAAEAAVVREVWEETRLRVESVEHVATQPWPFPRSLMLGYRARLAPGEHAARPDEEEVTGALVLSRAELAAAIETGDVVLPGPTSIARMLIEDWYGEEARG